MKAVCTPCFIDGVTTPAVYAIDNQTVCSRHAHPSYQPPRPKLTVFEGGRE